MKSDQTIIRYNPDGTVHDKFPSRRAAADSMGMNPNSIERLLNLSHFSPYKGHVWRKHDQPFDRVYWQHLKIIRETGRQNFIEITTRQNKLNLEVPLEHLVEDTSFRIAQAVSVGLSKKKLNEAELKAIIKSILS